MTNLKKWDCYTYSKAAEVLGVSVSKLRYAVDAGYLPLPEVVLKRRALFAPSQIEVMREYFAREETVGANERRKRLRELTEDVLEGAERRTERGEEKSEVIPESR